MILPPLVAKYDGSVIDKVANQVKAEKLLVSCWAQLLSVLAHTNTESCILYSTAETSNLYVVFKTWTLDLKMGHFDTSTISPLMSCLCCSFRELWIHLWCSDSIPWYMGRMHLWHLQEKCQYSYGPPPPVHDIDFFFEYTRHNGWFPNKLVSLSYGRLGYYQGQHHQLFFFHQCGELEHTAQPDPLLTVPINNSLKYAHCYHHWYLTID